MLLIVSVHSFILVYNENYSSAYKNLFTRIDLLAEEGKSKAADKYVQESTFRIKTKVFDSVKSSMKIYENFFEAYVAKSVAGASCSSINLELEAPATLIKDKNGKDDQY